MSQQVQELIDKIKTEGVAAADKKAKEIEEQAKVQAAAVIQDAQKEAQRLLAQAASEIKKKELASQMAIKQAGRDGLLSFRKEINRMLNKIVAQQVSSALTPEALAGILTDVIKNALQPAGVGDIRVTLSPLDLEKLRTGFLQKLQAETKRGVSLQSGQDIHKGFTISFDGGKSSFDFSDVSLAEYLGSYVNEEVAGFLKESAKG